MKSDEVTPVITLKPCPFCGSEPTWMKVYVNKQQTASYELQCVNEDCTTNPVTLLFSSPAEAADAWNTRTN